MAHSGEDTRVRSQGKRGIQGSETPNDSQWKHLYVKQSKPGGCKFESKYQSSHERVLTAKKLAEVLINGYETSGTMY